MIIHANIPLADKVWFKTGGNAQFYAEPITADDFVAALAFARERQLPVFVLGQGANVLISDDGYQGLVIRPYLPHITCDKKTGLVTAQAGVIMQDLIDYSLTQCLIGLEEFSGIPGTVGGSVYINIHYFEYLLDAFLHSARVIHAATGAITKVHKEWFAFGYNTSQLGLKEYYLVDATFQLKHVSLEEAAYARGRRDEIVRHRRRRYPAERTCGSFFRNFLPQELAHASGQRLVPYVAFYFDNLGFKGSLRHGGAFVSHQHANMIITDATATSSDVINLARHMQQEVYNRFGLIPQPECQLIGFATYPLL